MIHQDGRPTNMHQPALDLHLWGRQTKLSADMILTLFHGNEFQQTMCIPPQGRGTCRSRKLRPQACSWAALSAEPLSSASTTASAVTSRTEAARTKRAASKASLRSARVSRPLLG